MTRYCIGYLAEGEIVPYFQAMTADLESRFGIKNLSRRVPPHLTLKYPFETEDASLTENAIESVIASKSSISFILDAFGRFEEDSKTIFLATHQNDELLSSIKDCIRKLGEFDEDRKFSIESHKPHLSIARNLDPALSDIIWEYLQTLPPPRIELSFDNITLFEFADEAWKAKRIFRMTR